MINFKNDYNSPGHPVVLQAISEAAGVKYSGYGEDEATEYARNCIIELITSGEGRDPVRPNRCAEADIHFLSGGTQTNLTAIAAFLRPHEAVIAPDSAHVQVHETGAIEAAGHRILLVGSNGGAGGSGESGAGGSGESGGSGSAPSGGSGSATSSCSGGSGSSGNAPSGGSAISGGSGSATSSCSGGSGSATSGGSGGSGGSGNTASGGAGKLTAADVRAICRLHNNEHMVKPRLVYISQSTELGTIYSIAELAELRAACDEYGLLLYMDGARLGVALTAPCNDAPLAYIASICDAFYLGGTKNGLLFGEALVIVNPALKEDFRYLQKQRGGLLAKGFLLGLQFGAILKDNLYFKIASHANEMAAQLRAGLENMGCRFFVDSPTNQLFPIVSNGAAERLANKFLFETWAEVGDDNTAIRLVTSWNTTETEVQAFLDAYKKSIL